MTASSVAADVRWLTSIPGLGSGGCVSFVRKSRADREILVIFGADPSIELNEAPADWADRVGVVEIAGHGLIAIEPDGGYQGTRPEVLGDLARLSDSGRSAGVHWNVNDAVYLACAEGKKLTLVDLSGWDGSDVASLPGSLRRWAKTHIDDLVTDPVSAAIAMASMFAGLAPLPTGLVTAPSFVAVVPRPSSEIADTLASTPLGDRDPDMAVQLGQLSSERQRRIAGWVSQRLLEIAHLDDDPQLLEVVAQFGKVDGNPRVTPGARRRLGAIRAGVDAEEHRCALADRGPSRLLRRLWTAHWTGYCLQYACHPDSATAAWRAVYASIFALANAEMVDPDNPLLAQFGTELRVQINGSD